MQNIDQGLHELVRCHWGGGITESCDGKRPPAWENGYVVVSPGDSLNVNGRLEWHIQFYMLPKIDMQMGRKKKNENIRSAVCESCIRYVPVTIWTPRWRARARSHFNYPTY
jgi:hypothetical protein